MELEVTEVAAVGEKSDPPAVRRVARQAIDVGAEGQHPAVTRPEVSQADAG